jgi:hypothetical protein
MNVAVNGDFTFCAFNDSNDVGVVTRPHRTTCTRFDCASALNRIWQDQILEKAKRSFRGTGFQSLVKAFALLVTIVTIVTSICDVLMGYIRHLGIIGTDWFAGLVWSSVGFL